MRMVSIQTPNWAMVAVPTNSQYVIVVFFFGWVVVRTREEVVEDGFLVFRDLVVLGLVAWAQKGIIFPRVDGLRELFLEAAGGCHVDGVEVGERGERDRSERGGEREEEKEERQRRR